MAITRGTDPTKQLTVNWAAGADNADGVTYKILLVTAGSEGTEGATSSATSHSFSKLTPGQRYNVKVWAVTADGSQTSTKSTTTDIHTSKCGLESWNLLGMLMIYSQHYRVITHYRAIALQGDNSLQGYNTLQGDKTLSNHIIR